MKTKFYFFITALVLIFSMLKTKAQSNSVTDSVITRETFGSGTSRVALPAGRTTYVYNSASSLSDGDYMIYKRTNGRPEWHDAADHTGNSNGRAMIINAGITAAEFYRDTIYNLSGNTIYNVSLYIMNVNTLGTCGTAALLPKVQFIVEYYNAVTGSYQQLTTFNSGFIPQSASPAWVQVGGTFTNPNGNSIIRYRLINNSTGGCGNDLAIDDIAFARGLLLPGALPVTGLYLSAQSNGNAINLAWQTQSEYNSSYFIAEKSNDGINWNEIAAMQAMGYSNTEKNYNTVDAKAGTINYYRIKQVDKNGHFVYSNTIRVNLAAAAATVYPNPFVNHIQVDVATATAQKTLITLTDMQGRILLVKNWQLVKGNNSIVLPEVKQLAAGLYMLQVKAANGNVLFKTNLLKN